MDCKEKVTITGFVYFDENGNNIRELSEKGLKVVGIDLVNKEGKVVQTSQTEEDGQYDFEVCKGDYKLVANYDKGESSYLDRTEYTLSKSSNYSDFYNFKVIQRVSFDISIIYLGIVATIGFVAIYLVNKGWKKN